MYLANIFSNEYYIRSRIFYLSNFLKIFLSILKIRQLYDTLPFDDPNGGIWSQGFDIQYNASQWTSTNKLKIILMPHSHCDPGEEF